MAFVAVRFVLYTAAVFLFLILLPHLVRDAHIGAFRENGPVESLQVALLLTAALLFLLGARPRGGARQLLVCLAFVTLFGVARELDSALEAWVPVFNWKGPAAIVALAGAVYFFSHLRVVLTQLRAFVGTAPFALLWSGAVQSLIVAQLLGHGHFLKALIGEDYTRSYKRVLEESGELCGYSILLFGAVETVLYVRSRRAANLPQETTGSESGDHAAA
ncbi:MAG: hypothetical protein R6V58_00680 [Planctomycetota bacterium]